MSNLFFPRAAALLAGMALLPTVAHPQTAPAPAASSRALTIYNQNFAVVRQTVPLTLSAGVNHVTFNDITSHLEPDSVVLRDPAGRRALTIREQNYRADPITQDLLLSLYEGKTIDFFIQRPDGTTRTVRGKIVRSGYVPRTGGFAQYGYSQGYGSVASGQPIIEVDGKLQFQLPGVPQFPTLTDDTILKPTLDWTLETDTAGPLNAELAYVTSGMSWKADYNLVAPENGTTLDLTGWVTMDNQSGKTFDSARIKLMAGDVNKVQSGYGGEGGFGGGGFGGGRSEPAVTEKSFDEYHLYTLEHPTTLRDRETKQVEFVRAAKVVSKTIYIYDGTQFPTRNNPNDYYSATTQRVFVSQPNTKVAVGREFVNSAANGLGVPLPKGRLRFYRRDADGQLEFTGENTIDHTPKDETVRVNTGNAFDLVGEWTQTDFKVDEKARTVDESITIKLRNHKTVPVEIRAVEHLYRGVNWAISVKSDPFIKTDARTIEFRVTVPPNGEHVVTYTAHYSW